MASAKLENEVIEILDLIHSGNNFLLSGGAGSGKTYSLVSIINEIYKENPFAKIACITYTNAATHEIENRVANKKFKISTIHDFLWENISSYQKELKQTLIEGINSEPSCYKNIYVEKPYNNDFDEGIKYTEYLWIETGNISHDEIIVLANQMYKKYPKLCDILNNKYDFIFVDEYQDTFPDVVEILLECLSCSNTKNKSIIGFFGDSMQAIYDNGIGDLDKYIDEKRVIEVQKKQNRRNPQSVINLANKLRTDGLQQEPSTDKSAPNMIDGLIKEGSIKFLYGGEISLDALKATSYFAGWDFNNAQETKEMRLTHNLIAATAGFPTLMEIYDKDPIIKLKNDFCKFIKDKDVDTSGSFDEVIQSVEWKYSDRARNKEYRGRSQIEVFLEDEKNARLYNMIKNMAFLDVRKIYVDKDNLLAEKKQIDEISGTQSKRDKLIRHLFQIQSIVKMYKDKNYNDFLRKTSFKITTVKDKQQIKSIIETLTCMQDKTIGEVIEYADKNELCVKDDNINNFIKQNQYLFERVSEVKYTEFVCLYNYLEGFSPLSTQHKTKGEEYKNVLVILDNGKWNDYNFEYLFNPLNKKSNPKVLDRTRKLFYVCCTRAMDNLVVYCEKPSNEMIETAKQWFGENNCKPV